MQGADLITKVDQLLGFSAVLKKVLFYLLLQPNNLLGDARCVIMLLKQLVFVNLLLNFCSNFLLVYHSRFLHMHADVHVRELFDILESTFKAIVRSIVLSYKLLQFCF